MNIHLRPEFEELKPDLEKNIELALQERKEMGLGVPMDFDVRLSYSKGNGALGTTVYMLNQPSKIYFYLMQFLRLDSKNKIKKTIDDINSFQYSQSKNVGNGDVVKLLKSSIKSGNAKYSKAELVEWKDNIRQWLPEMKSQFKKNSLDAIRHELEHVDFNEYNISDVLGKASKVFYNGSSYEEHLYTLKNYLRIQTLAEIKSLFFTHVPIREWEDMDLDKTSESVLNHYVSVYAERNFLKPILSSLIRLDAKLNRIKINESTENFLYNKLLGEEWDYDEKNIIRKIADKIPDKLDMWKDFVRERAEEAVGTIGRAYKHNPLILKHANFEAYSFRDYIDICNSAFS